MVEDINGFLPLAWSHGTRLLWCLSRYLDLDVSGAMSYYMSSEGYASKNSHDKINSLWAVNVSLWHQSGLTLAQVMAWCLTAPSHYLNLWIENTDVHPSVISQKTAWDMLANIIIQNWIFINLLKNKVKIKICYWAGMRWELPKCVTNNHLGVICKYWGLLFEYKHVAAN